MSTNKLRSAIAISTLFSSMVPAWAQDAAHPGKAIADAQCNSCHPLGARVGSGYTEEGWKTVMRMMTNHGVPVPPDQLAALTDYLAKTYPVKGRPDAVLVPGSAKVSMKAWQAPTPGSRPHDPLAAKDGSLWYTGQMVNALGRVDPKTGKVKEYPLKTPHSGPHGLVEDKDGNIWYTGNTGALVGKLNPKSGEVTEYKMPDSKGDPHTLIFDRSGILWVTLQNANAIARLDPKTGEIKLLTPPTPKSRPYGMAVNSKGTVYYVAFGINKVGAVNPKTLQIREFDLPDKASRPRRIAITGLLPRVPRQARSRNRPDQGMAVTERTEVGTLWDLGDQGRHLVQRIRGCPKHSGALRSQDREIPKLGDSRGRKHRAQHGCDEARRLRPREQPHQRSHPGPHRQVGAFFSMISRAGALCGT
jgi:virginiamycin B lyase